mgnify:CR=1 FL=1
MSKMPLIPQRVSEFSAISGLLKKSDAEIAEELSKVRDFKRLASQLSLYDDGAVNRIINGLPPENRHVVKKMTTELKDVHNWVSRQHKPGDPVYGRLIYETTHINIKKLLPSLVLAIILLAMSGYMV